MGESDISQRGILRLVVALRKTQVKDKTKQKAKGKGGLNFSSPVERVLEASGERRRETHAVSV